LRIWRKLGKDRGGGKHGLEGLKGRAAFRIKVPQDILPGQPIEWSSDSRIILNKLVIEVSKSQEWLDIFDFARFWPISYSFDFGRIHSDSSGSYQESQVFYGSPVEFALLSFGVKLMTLKASQNFADLLLMRFQVIGVDQDVIEVDDDANIHQIGEDVIHELLESGWGIAKTKRHNQVFEGAEPHVEGSLPFISRQNLN
jgi:hypothetical protein